MEIQSAQPNYLTVSQLNRQIRSLLEYDVGEVQVAGELSNLAKPASGHLYFTLKDDQAQIRCVFFRNHHTRETRQFDNGQQVIARGRLSLYEARGDYQLIVQELTSAGLGELYRQFELLKARLEQQGLFAQARKRPIPRLPSAIAVVTSATGAAIKDILSTLARRFPIAHVYVYPTEVQGKDAAVRIAKAINQANIDGLAEVMILARGGGSIEDLWAFNDEQLALTIANSRIPIVSGVGHETDFTIADFVADLRAATPTAAAETVTPDKIELHDCFSGLINRIQTAMASKIRHQQFILSHQLAKLTSPEHIISSHWQTLDYLERRLHQQLQAQINRNRHRLHLGNAALHAKNPIVCLHQAQARIILQQQQLVQAIRHHYETASHHFQKQLAKLHTVSPLATLQRGYSIATHNDSVLFAADQVELSDTIDLRLAKGRLSCKIIGKGV
ncbi:exodeoxyribonuclease VII large subunit [Legionella dresdenensis]|uniref:Exodeoxyribonuclease 7 large subunit n=1 Tax=Legionella dresdenensis TaxID=450200 RepID=A0ABV8CC16_9GAMM